jgi:hypothetical protein
VPNTTALLEHERFPNLITFSPAINDFVKESKKVSQINPESTIEASGVDSAIEEGVMTFDHHKPSALEALHTCPTLSNRMRKKTTSGVLASRRGSTYGPRYDSPLRSMRPCWMAFLRILHGHSLSTHLNIRTATEVLTNFPVTCYAIEYDS